MRGILTKMYEKWVIIYNEKEPTGEIIGKSVPVHPDDCWINNCDGNEGTEYEFEIDRTIKLDSLGMRYTELTAKLLYKIDNEEQDLWIDIYHKVKRTGKETIYDVFVWLKENYEPPKVRGNEDQ
jgi:hypothetical protein